MEEKESEEIQIKADNQSALSAENLVPDKNEFLKIKFNHEEHDLDEKTARELAQKGMNYDKIKAKLDEIMSEGGAEKADDETKTETVSDKNALKEQVEKLEKQLSGIESELQKERQNRFNAGSSASSVAGFGTAKDDGLYSEEQLNSLSASEIQKNLDKAMRSMSFISKSKLK